MFILREDIKHDEGENLLIGLTDIWNYFYTELLPAVQVILYGVKPVSSPYMLITCLSQYYNLPVMRL